MLLVRSVSAMATLGSVGAPLLTLLLELEFPEAVLLLCAVLPLAYLIPEFFRVITGANTEEPGAPDGSKGLDADIARDFATLSRELSVLRAEVTRWRPDSASHSSSLRENSEVQITLPGTAQLPMPREPFESEARKPDDLVTKGPDLPSTGSGSRVVAVTLEGIGASEAVSEGGGRYWRSTAPTPDARSLTTPHPPSDSG